ncbi:MAG: hypothetical protein US54_C0074G0002 [Candidatus Roizmanbacteria bacterium GW2011_GWA2_37_7]|uniref:Uncharacterized protein n=1 Tax=Candidatus Roizmanbacteria bacterium GW2011_GWA2_37_7 TaxID=1618481 RepID=A0A0G0K6L8_9BACT|nr:MAG: hypothetical protein US54_C0074G0002 [Candidatus Roizmanbacteria bacterium GW2011_GWA2_37_7]
MIGNVKEVPLSEVNIDSLEGQIELAKLRANTFRYHISADGISGKSAYGKLFSYGLDWPLVIDHGHHHSRHVKKTIRYALKEYDTFYPGALDPNDPETLSDLSALMLFSYNHDGLDQQVSAIRNLVNTDIKLPVKRGHALAGSVMLMAYTPEYAQRCGIPIDEACLFSSLSIGPPPTMTSLAFGTFLSTSLNAQHSKARIWFYRRFR